LSPQRAVEETGAHDGNDRARARRRAARPSRCVIAPTAPPGRLGCSRGLAKQEWDTVLHLIAGKMKRELGDDYDLTWNVVYATGPAKDLGRYFSNGKKAPGSTLLDPRDREQVADYERNLKEIYLYIYKLQRIDDKDQVTKVLR
jgi:hypothetical protein